MKRTAYIVLYLLAAVGLHPTAASAQENAAPQVREWLGELEQGLARTAGDADANTILRLYLDYFEPVETVISASDAPSALDARVLATESRFHEAMRAAPAEREVLVTRLREDVSALVAALPATIVVSTAAGSAAPARTGTVRHAEIAAIIDELERAEAAYAVGDRSAAMRGVEHAYLEGIELLEARLPASRTGAIEHLVHLQLRPQISSGAPVAKVSGVFGALRNELLAADGELAGAATFWFGATNSFLIILREGLEAVLLVGALLAYLKAIGQGHRMRQIYGGVLLGLAASFATWWAARGLLHISGASREIIEGVTALIAVAVLLYVSHWLFQKTYIHDWKEYLRTRASAAVASGSSWAMAGLAFAAVYREGFETVLFYQALLFDAGANAVLAGAVPGFLLVLGVGFAIVRLGLKLPLKRVFAATNMVLVFLAFTFLGKGIYNIQEGGAFAPHPVGWVPDHPALSLVFGIYPIAETLIAQGVLLTVLAGLALFYRHRLTAAAEPVSVRAAAA